MRGWDLREEEAAGSTSVCPDFPTWSQDGLWVKPGIPGSPGQVVTCVPVLTLKIHSGSGTLRRA